MTREEAIANKRMELITNIEILQNANLSEINIKILDSNIELNVDKDIFGDIVNLLINRYKENLNTLNIISRF